jgi:CBS domain-containing protein
MRIADICTHSVIHVDPDLSVRDAAKLMRKKHVGTLMVVEQPDGERIPVGIVTDRDIVVAVIASEVDPDTLTVGDIMTRQLATCAASQELFDAVQTMRSRGVRRLPVLNRHGGLCGMLSADDIIAAMGTHLGELAHALSHGQVREMEVRT